MRYFLSLPHGYGKDDPRRWPVVVCVSGADSVFQHRAENYAVARGDMPFIMVTPCTFSSTNEIEGPRLTLFRQFYSDVEIQDAQRDRLAWDEAGLLAILSDLRKDFRAEDRAYMTGFSGGGILTYHMLLKRPGLIRTAVPVCANYFGHGEFQKSPLTPAESAVPVRIFRGEHDPLQENLLPSPPWLLGALAGASLGIGVVLWRRTRQWRWLIAVVTLAAIASVPIVLLPWDGLDPQTSAAVRHLTECGYTDVTVTTIDGMGHEPATDRVVGIFKQVLDAPSP